MTEKRVPNGEWERLTELRQTALSSPKRLTKNRISLDRSYLTSLWEQEDTEHRAHSLRVEVSVELGHDDSVSSVSSDDSSPWSSEFALVGVLGFGDLANSLSEVPLGGLGVVNSLDLDKSLVGVLGVLGSNIRQSSKRRQTSRMTKIIQLIVFNKRKWIIPSESEEGSLGPKSHRGSVVLRLLGGFLDDLSFSWFDGFWHFEGFLYN